MKHISRTIMSFATLGSLLLLVNCSENNDPIPLPAPDFVITATVMGNTVANGGEVEAVEEVWFSVDITAEAGFSVLNVSGDFSGQYPLAIYGVGGDDTKAFVTFGYETTSDEVGTSITLNFEAVDFDGQTTSDSFTFNVASSPNAKVYSNVFLESSLDNTTTTFLDINTNITYSNDDIINSSLYDNIDFGYVPTDQGGFLSGPSSFPALDLSSWTVKHETRMLIISSDSYSGITSVADVKQVFKNNSEWEGFSVPYWAEDLQVGDVVLFQTRDLTQDGVRGIFKVIDIMGALNPGDGITLEFKMEEPDI